MSLLDKLERVFGRWALPNVSLFLVMGQVGVCLGLMLGRLEPDWFVLIPQLVLAGQWWRLFTFLLMPPPTSYLFVVFAWWMFYLMGNALESLWGAFHYNLFLLIGWAFTVGLAFLDPIFPVTNAFLAGSVFLAFAYLNPDFQLALFFIIPIRIKWLAAFTWVVYAIKFVTGGWSARLQIIAAVGNFGLFFGGDLIRSMRQVRRRQAGTAIRVEVATQAGGGARHRCRICNRTDVSNPELDFRYCSKCAGDACYCTEHLFTHVHLTEADAAKTASR